MYKKLSKNSKIWFWTVSIALLILLIYSIMLIPYAGWFELIIAGLGWLYIIISFFGWMDCLPKIMYANKKQWNLFFPIAIIGIIGALIIDLKILENNNPKTYPLIFIPAIIVITYLIVGTNYMNKKKK